MPRTPLGPLQPSEMVCSPVCTSELRPGELSKVASKPPSRNCCTSGGP